MLINTALGKKNQAIGRSKGGLSTKIHARTDALGNPTGFYLTDGQVHDLNGSDVLLDLSLSQTWLMDKAYNSRDRVIAPILAAKGQIVMPAKSNSIDQRDYGPTSLQGKTSDRELFCQAQAVSCYCYTL